MVDDHAIDIASLIDNHPVRLFQMRIMLLCALVAMLDGFDTQVIGFVAPILTSAWQINPAGLGLVFAAGLLGLACGAVFLGPVSDRIGRRAVIIGSTAWFGAFSVLTAQATTPNELALFRFLTGLGLGGAMPNIIALTAEFTPHRLRATLVTLMFCGFPLGAVFGGLASARLAPVFGWQSVFYLGGILPLVLVPLLLVALPESIIFLARRARTGNALKKLVRKMSPELTHEGSLDIFISEAQSEGAPFRKLLAPARRTGTLLMWLMFFSNLLTLFFLINWVPTILSRAGAPVTWAIIAIVGLNLGGAIGGLLISLLIDHYRTFRALTLLYLAGAAFTWLIGVDKGLVATIAVVGAAGFCLIGAQFGINALAAAFYPSALRATGVGAALGLGRIGSIVGPVLGGWMIGAGWSLPDIFIASAIPTLVAGGCAYCVSGMIHREEMADSLQMARGVAAGEPDVGKRGLRSDRTAISL